MAIASNSKMLKMTSSVTNQFIDVFTDASSEAYGAVAFLQSVFESGEYSSRLIMSKARVAPLKSTSIPRLELLEAVFGLKLAERIAGALKMALQDVRF
eukprot:gene10305-19003_t